MKPFTIVAASILVAMVSGQLLPDSSDHIQPAQYQEPFQNPGEIIHNSGLTISFLMNAVGGIWQQERVIDSLDYACTNVLPSIGSMIPEVDQSSFYWGHICDKVSEAAEDLDAFDASGFCNDIVDMITDLFSQDTPDYRVRRQVDPSMEDPLDIIEILTDIVKDLYNIDINKIIDDLSQINTICIDVKDNLLKPSVFTLISDFGTELMTALLPRAQPICQDIDGFLQSVGIEPNSTYYPIIEGAAFRIGSQSMGYDSIDALCQELDRVLAVQGDNNEARKQFSRNIITSIFDILTEADRCSALANGAIDDVVEPLLRIENPEGFDLTDDIINTYTGYQGVTAVCNSMEIAFTTIVDLPDPVPVELIPDTTLTVEFYIDAAGGIWQQDRLIDSLAFVCTDVLPDLESMIPDFKTFTQDTWNYQPVCDIVLEAAENLEAFDATGFCEEITNMITDMTSDSTGGIYRRQADDTMSDPLDILQTLGDITKDLYNIDINDPSTICPNVAQFLSKSIPDIIKEFGAAVMAAYLPQAVPICEDWYGTFSQLGIDTTSPYYPIIQDAARIASQLVGYDSRRDLCQAIQNVAVDSKHARTTFAEEVIDNAFGLYTDTARCTMYGNDLIDHIIEPIVHIKAPDVPLMISNYTIARYTGFNGVEGVCRAMETAFTKLSTSTVTLQVTGESHNGEVLVYTTDLANSESPRFKKLEKLYCGGVNNHVNNIGLELRKLDCRVLMFSAGSIIAEMELEVHATSQDVADTLAREIADLSTDDSLVLSSDGESLSVSSLKGTAEVGSGGGLSTGVIIGIVIGVIVLLMLVIFAIICVVTHSGKSSITDTERGVGHENPGYRHF